MICHHCVQWILHKNENAFAQQLLTKQARSWWYVLIKEEEGYIIMGEDGWMDEWQYSCTKNITPWKTRFDTRKPPLGRPSLLLPRGQQWNEQAPNRLPQCVFNKILLIVPSRFNVTYCCLSVSLWIYTNIYYYYHISVFIRSMLFTYACSECIQYHLCMSWNTKTCDTPKRNHQTLQLYRCLQCTRLPIKLNRMPVNKDLHAVKTNVCTCRHYCACN